ncbi:heme-degrading domain-containing protein [Streptomyces misionensis]|uniref:heme-degrading domain-containing protein n=1 Tax=Streptomyces misionensis TaxID=67331 RepID=UPI0038095E65
MSQSTTAELAPAPTIEELEEQERRLVFQRFSYEDAWALGSLLVEMARERRLPIAIDIHRAGQQLFHAALPGSTPDNDAWIDRKRRVAVRYGAPSYLVGSRFRAKGTTFEHSSRLDPDVYAAHGGSFPIRVADVGVIGAVTVSGLPQVEDHRLVVAALEKFLGTSAG